MRAEREQAPSLNLHQAFPETENRPGTQVPRSGKSTSAFVFIEDYTIEPIRTTGQPRRDGVRNRLQRRNQSGRTPSHQATTSSVNNPVQDRRRTAASRGDS